MSDVECPYCEEDQEINHDDGFGYAEDEMHEMECSNCEKNFVFTTSILFLYTPSKADCLNGSEHQYQATHTYPREYTKMECTHCDHRRKPTDNEMQVIMADTQLAK